jgi:alkaline phosphatase D
MKWSLHHLETTLLHFRNFPQPSLQVEYHLSRYLGTVMPMLSRRKFLKFGLASSSAAFVTTVLPGCEWLDDDDDVETPLGKGSFLHGIASGDPLTDSVILWTRVTPDDQAATAVLVAWDIATDLEFTNIIASARGTAVADSDFTVKVDVKGLDAESVYYYRFRTLENYTVAGTTRTLPDGTADSLNLAVMSCANYSSGYFHVYQEVAQNTDLDIVLHLGDYLYEYANGIYPLEADTVRAVLPDAELVTLDQYRTRYAQYRTDLDLQAAHAAVPFIMV